MEWQCKVCTLLNPQSETACTICGSDRKGDALSDEAYARLLAQEEELQQGNDGGEESEEEVTEENSDEEEPQSKKQKNRSEKSSAPVVKTPSAPLSAFEQQRQEKIRRNQEALAQLGISSLVAQTTGSVKAAPPPTIKKRKSKRKVTQDSDDNEEGSEDDEAWKPTGEVSGDSSDSDRPKRSRGESEDDEDDAPKRKKRSKAKPKVQKERKTPARKSRDAGTSVKPKRATAEKKQRGENGRTKEEDDGMKAFLASNRPESKGEGKLKQESKSKTAPNEFSVQDMKDCFKLLDKDRDGLLTYTDLVMSCFAAKEDMSEEALQAMLEYASKKTGKISLDDFLDLTKKKVIRAR